MSERETAEARAAARAERRAAREEFERRQIERVAEEVEAERERFRREVELRNRDEARGAPPGWSGAIVVGPDATPEVRRAIGNGE